MEWLKALRGAVVGLDTAPLIYFIEENPLYLPLVRPFFEAVDHADFQVVTSVLTAKRSQSIDVEGIHSIAYGGNTSSIRQGARGNALESGPSAARPSQRGTEEAAAGISKKFEIAETQSFGDTATTDYSDVKSASSPVP